jgi:hypothetical protein
MALVVVGPIGTVLVLLEVDHVGTLPLRKVTFTPQSAGFVCIVIELCRPIPPDTANAENDESGKEGEKQNAQQHA